ncbi:hypothetical protein LWC34_10180 [Kibdelosporangium philippinense]|uniref:Uncharacterized protein n=1 Tax=Kibdelosporangium philippinense TaxID=211113 RepID=A0ABS8Z5S0_9PSEU|nr:hypothetical protein [Kibdelosporangium philippinense]MCE7003195.1 hypothetical protein [Kibdelosporangium philippinense]
MAGTSRPINSANAYIDAQFVVAPKDFPVLGRTIVVNPNLTPLTVGEEPVRHIPAFSSTVLVDTTIEQGDSVLLFRVLDEDNMADIVNQPDWSLFADLLPGFPRSTQLYRGPVDQIGTIEFDPDIALAPTRQIPPSRGALAFTLPEGSDKTGNSRTFRISVNLWFAPAGTDCAIHNVHEFIEIHSQIHGYGRMQKFKQRDHSTLYEDQLMSPGHTPPVPFSPHQAGRRVHLPVAPVPSRHRLRLARRRVPRRLSYRKERRQLW